MASATTHLCTPAKIAADLGQMLGSLGCPPAPVVTARIESMAAPRGSFASGGTSGFRSDGRTEKLINRCLRDPGHLYLFGPPGTGKSTAARAAFEQMGIPYARISCHPGMDSDEFIGTVEPKVSPDGRQTFEAKWAPLVLAAEQGTGVILEEVNSLLPERSFSLFSLLDDSPGFLAQVCGSERMIMKHPGFKVIATANDNGTGENMAQFAGIQVMNSALRDRFSRQVRIGYLPEAEEAQMVHARTGIPMAFASKMVALATETRTRAASGEGVEAVSPRSLLAWAQSCVGSVADNDGLTWWDAAEVSFASRQESHNIATLRTMVVDRFTARRISFT